MITSHLLNINSLPYRFRDTVLPAACPRAMQSWPEPCTDDDQLDPPSSVFMSNQTLQSLHSQGWFETERFETTHPNGRALQINDTIFMMDELSEESDTQYEAFLLEVERTNNELFMSKSAGFNHHQPAASSEAATHKEFDYEAYDNGEYYDVDTDDAANYEDYYLGNGRNNGDEYMEELEEDDENCEDGDEEVEDGGEDVEGVEEGGEDDEESSDEEIGKCLFIYHRTLNQENL